MTEFIAQEAQLHSIGHWIFGMQLHARPLKILDAPAIPIERISDWIAKDLQAAAGVEEAQKIPGHRMTGLGEVLLYRRLCVRTNDRHCCQHEGDKDGTCDRRRATSIHGIRLEKRNNLPTAFKTGTIVQHSIQFGNT